MSQKWAKFDKICKFFRHIHAFTILGLYNKILEHYA